MANYWYFLDPRLVVPLVADNGDVYYQLQRDPLSELPSAVTVPASEIIHDRWNTLYHPLVGLSPIYAAGVSALTSLNIQRNSANLFKNSARPGGVLTAPNAIEESTAQRLKAYFEENFTGDLAGKVAVLGDGLEYKHFWSPSWGDLGAFTPWMSYSLLLDQTVRQGVEGRGLRNRPRGGADGRYRGRNA